MHISDQQLPRDTNFTVYPRAVAQRPDLLLLIGAIIATWADIEGRLEAILLACTKDEAALAEMRNVKGWDARSKFFVRRVHDEIGENFAIEAQSILRFVALPSKKRHDLAHGIYGVSEGFPTDLIIFTPQFYTAFMEEAVRAEAEGNAKLVIKRERLLETARLVTKEHLEQLLTELDDAASVLHEFMVEQTPQIVRVHNREALPRASEHPAVAARIRDSIAGRRARDRQRRRSGAISHISIEE